MQWALLWTNILPGGAAVKTCETEAEQNASCKTKLMSLKEE